MQNTCSRLEKRLAQRLAASAPLARRTAGENKIDLAYLSKETQDHLNNNIPRV